MDVDEAAVRVSRRFSGVVRLSIFIIASFQELFHKTCGPVKSCSLAYDSKGKSKGVADVVFQRRGDAQKAFDQCSSKKSTKCYRSY